MTDRERVEQEIEEAAKKLAPTEYDAPTIKGIKAALFAERVKGLRRAAEMLSPGGDRQVIEALADELEGK
jgi:hypothetical protein